MNKTYTVSRKKSAKWNIIFQYYNIAFSIVWGLILIPLYLKYIPYRIYGAWLATGNIVAWLTVLDPGINDVERQQVSQCYGEKKLSDIGAIFYNSLLLSILVSLIVFLIGYIFSFYIHRFIKLTDSIEIVTISKAFVLAVIGSALTIFSFHFRAFNHGLLSSVGIGFVDVCATVISLITTIVLLVKGVGVCSIPIGIIIKALVYIIGNLLYTFWRTWKESIPLRVSFRGMKSLIKLTSFNVLGKLGYVLYQNVDSFLVARFLGTELTPILHLTKKASDISMSFINRPILSVIPIINNIYYSGKQEKIKSVLEKYITIAIWAIALVFLGLLTLNDSFVTIWVGESIYAGFIVNLIICFLFVITLISNISSSLLFGLGKIKESSIVNFIQSLISVIFMFVGIKYYGIVGIVLGQVLSQILLSFWYFPSHLLKTLRFSKQDLLSFMLEILIVIGIDVFLFVIFKNIHSDNWMSFIGYILLVTISYIIALLCLSKKFRNTLFPILLNKNLNI